MGATYAFGRFAVAPLARLIYRPHVEGSAHVPNTGPVIFASNHLSFIDSIAIPVAAPRPVHFLAKSSYFDGSGISGWFSREFFTSIGAMPCSAAPARRRSTRSTSSGSSSWRATRSRSTPRARGRSTAGSTRAAPAWRSSPSRPVRPVVPVGLIGTDEVMPVGARCPRSHQRVTVRFGEPLDLAHHGPAESGRARRLATDDIMAAIHALSGQELANEYNEAPAHNPIERIRQVLPHERR